MASSEISDADSSYNLGNTTMSITPVRSSSVKKAMGWPVVFVVTLRRDVIIPPTATSSPSLYSDDNPAT